MNSRAKQWAATLLGLLAVATAAWSQDIRRVPPEPGSLQVKEVQGIGRPQTLLVREGTLYVGGTKGIAAIDSQGEVLWSVSMPEVDGRAVDVEGDHVAYTGFRITGVDRGRGLSGALMWGAPSQKLLVESADVGLLSRSDGKTVWSENLKEPTALSAPALGQAAVAVQAAKSVLLYDRATGNLIKEVSTFTNWLGLSEGYNSRMQVMRPLWVKDGVFVAHQSWMKKLSPTGAEMLATKSLGKNFFFLTSGPILCNGKVILSEAAYPEGNIFSGKKAWVYGATPDGSAVLGAQTDDDVNGIGDLACNNDSIFAVGNAHISAFGYDGAVKWRFTSKGGAMLFGTQRGILRAGTLPIAHQIAAGRQALVNGAYLYVTARNERGGTLDVINVFDAKSGELLEKIDVKTMVADMAVFNDNLALTTAEGLRFVALKK